MSRIQTRVSDHRRSQLEGTVGRPSRPSVLTPSRSSSFEPRVAIRLGQTESSAPIDLRKSPNYDHAEQEGLFFSPNQLLQCEYHLMDFDGYECQQVRRHRRLIPTLRRRRRGAVVGKSLSTKDSSNWVRRRQGVTEQAAISPTITAIENSVVWQTTGKGDTDFGVHFFERREAKKHQPMELYRPYVFRTLCPNSPLTYRGKLLSISWLVRVRVFLSSGDGLTFERSFQLRPTS